MIYIYIYIYVYRYYRYLSTYTIAFDSVDLWSVCGRDINNSSFYNGVKYYRVGSWLRIGVIVLVMTVVVFVILYSSFILIVVIVLSSSPFQMLFFISEMNSITSNINCLCCMHNYWEKSGFEFELHALRYVHYILFNLKILIDTVC